MKAKKRNKKPVTDKKDRITPQRIYITLFFLIIILYVNTIGHGYVLDDAIVISENIFTKKGFSGLIDIFSHDTFRGFFQQGGKDKLVTGGRYRPLSQAMFAIEYGLFGLRPWIGHAANILWYILTSFSVFLVVRKIAEVVLVKKNQAILFAGVLAVVFAAHPVHTEVVANIKGRDEILVLLGGIWSLYFSWSYLESGKWVPAILSGFCMFLSLLAKENALAFVAVIPLTIFFFKSKKAYDLLRSSVPLLFATFIYLLIRFSILGFDLGAEPPRELMNNPFLKLQNGSYEPMTMIEKAPLIIYGLLKYVQLLFVPHPLTHDYYPKIFEMISWSSPSVIAAILLFLTMFGVVIFKSGKWKIVSYCILFFALTIFLTSNIMFPVGTHLSERFLFTPSLAFTLLITSGWFWLYQNNRLKLAWLLLGILVSFYGIKSVTRNRVWKTNYTLFTSDVVTSHGSAKVQNAAGGEMIARAITLPDSLERNHEIDEAMDHLAEAIRIHPGYKNAYLLMGNGSFYLKQYEQAIKFYDQALQLDPAYREAIYNRALAYRDFGRYLGEIRGNLTAAIEYLEKAYAQLQDDYETNRLLGIAYGNQGQPERAISYFQKALTLKSDDAWTNYNLGLAYLAIQDSINANLYIARAKTLNPQVGN